MANKSSNRPGLIYILRALRGPLSDEGVYKIGRTINLERRLRKLQERHRTRFEVIHTLTTDDMRCTEYVLHRIYEDQSLDLEWFRLSEDDISRLCAVNHVPQFSTFLEAHDLLRPLLNKPAGDQGSAAVREAKRLALQVRWMATREAVDLYRNQQRRLESERTTTGG